MLSALLGLAVTLQAVLQIVQDLRHFGVADGMLAPGQGAREGTRALASPAQRRFGITPRALIDHRLQSAHQSRVGDGNRLAAGSRAPNTTFPRRSFFNFPDSLVDGFPRQSTSPAHQTHSTVAKCLFLDGGNMAPRTFV